MKLVQLLAKELKEWPESAKYITQEDDDGPVTLWYRSKPKYKSGEWVLDRHLDDSDYAYILHGIDTASDNKTSIVTQDRWQTEREKMNKPKWIRHRGGKCPVKAGTKVVTRYRDGLVSDWCMTRDEGTNEELLAILWSHNGGDQDIMAYYVEETKDQEIGEVKKTNFGTITYKLEIDATEATKEIDSLVAKWGQIESPLKWRDEIIELEAYEEEFRREREKLIRKLESEGFNLIDHAPAKCLLDEWEAMDYESFCVGDTVVCIHEKPDDTVAELTIGKEYRLILDDEQICVIDDIGDAMRYCIEIGCFKLVKRA